MPSVLHNIGEEQSGKRYVRIAEGLPEKRPLQGARGVLGTDTGATHVTVFDAGEECQPFPLFSLRTPLVKAHYRPKYMRFFARCSSYVLL
jgi:hypothetical protein